MLELFHRENVYQLVFTAAQAELFPELGDQVGVFIRAVQPGKWMSLAGMDFQGGGDIFLDQASLPGHIQHGLVDGDDIIGPEDAGVR